MKQARTSRLTARPALIVMPALALLQSPVCPPNRPTGPMVARGQGKIPTAMMRTLKVMHQRHN